MWSELLYFVGPDSKREQPKRKRNTLLVHSMNYQHEMLRSFSSMQCLMKMAVIANCVIGSKYIQKYVGNNILYRPLSSSASQEEAVCQLFCVAF